MSTGVVLRWCWTDYTEQGYGPRLQEKRNFKFAARTLLLCFIKNGSCVGNIPLASSCDALHEIAMTRIKAISAGKLCQVQAMLRESEKIVKVSNLGKCAYFSDLSPNKSLIASSNST